MKKTTRDFGDFIDRSEKCLLVGLGWLGKAADFPNELERRGPNLLFGNRRIEIEESLDVSAHLIFRRESFCGRSLHRSGADQAGHARGVARVNCSVTVKNDICSPRFGRISGKNPGAGLGPERAGLCDTDRSVKLDMERVWSKAFAWSGAMALLVTFLVIFLPARADDDKFPEGPGKATFLKVCSQCHPVDPIATLRYSKDEWKDLVDDMKGKGADATDEECDLIVDYLAKNFGKSADDQRGKQN
jgi:hypothetical protein